MAWGGLWPLDKNIWRDKMKTVNKNDLHALIGKETGVSDWLIVEQDRINEFASATGDHQFIHVNPEAAKKTPFGGTIAHGLLTLSLLPKFAEQGTVSLENVVMGVNYGFDKVRFLNPVKTGSKVRGPYSPSQLKLRLKGLTSQL